MTDRMLEAYVERHRQGAFTEKHLDELVAEIRRLRDEVKKSRHELMTLRRSRDLTNGQLQQARGALERMREEARAKESQPTWPTRAPDGYPLDDGRNLP